MTKKDYIVIADALRTAPTIGARTDDGVYGEAYWADDLIDALCDAFCSDNPSFKESVFRDYVIGE